MTETEQPAEERFIDRGDWSSAIVSLIFLIGFPIGIAAMWREPRDVAPLVYLVPFTAIFALGIPYLWKPLSTARTRELRVDTRTGEIIFLSQRPLQRQTERIAAASVRRLVFETHDNDGYWHCAMLELTDARRIQFCQGSHKASVQG